MEGDGKVTAYAGGWSDYISQRGGLPGGDPAEKTPKPKAQKVKPKPDDGTAKEGLSFKEKHRLEALPAEMERLEQEIAKLQELMADPELFTREPVKFKKATEALVERQEKLAASEEEWLELEEKAEG